MQSREGEEEAYRKEGNGKGGDRAGRKGRNHPSPGETEECRRRTSTKSKEERRSWQEGGENAKGGRRTEAKGSMGKSGTGG